MDQKKRLEQVLDLHETDSVPKDIAMRVFEVLDDISTRTRKGEIKHKGTSIAVGYTPAYSDHAKPMDDDYFDGRGCSIFDDDIADHIVRSADRYDGGITIDSAGNVLHGGMMFIADAGQVLDEMGIPNSRKLYERFGFCSRIGTRHTSCIAASYMMPGVLMYSLSEESNNVRVFKDGKILNSPYGSELPVVEKNPAEKEERGYLALLVAPVPA